MDQGVHSKFRWLRYQAEQLPDDSGLSKSDILQVIHELEFHQNQLQIDNKELRRAKQELELRVQEREAGLAVKSTELAECAAKLKKLNNELQEFAYIASHDLQESLRKIEYFGSILSEKCKESLGEQGQDYLMRMAAAARRMSELLVSLLDYSRIATPNKSWRGL